MIWICKDLIGPVYYKSINGVIFKVIQFNTLLCKKQAVIIEVYKFLLKKNGR